MAAWNGFLVGWHWVVNALGAVVLWCFLACVVLFVVELLIYRFKKRRDRS